MSEIIFSFLCFFDKFNCFFAKILPQPESGCGNKQVHYSVRNAMTASFLAATLDGTRPAIKVKNTLMPTKITAGTMPSVIRFVLS